MGRWLIALGVGLVVLSVGCQPGAPPTSTPEPAPLNIGTLPPTSTLPPTWTPIPTTPTPSRTPVPPATNTSPPPTPEPTDTPYPGCIDWQGVEMERQEEYLAGQPVVISWPVMPGVDGYRFLLRDPYGREIHHALIEQPVVPDTEEQVVRYEIDPALLQGEGYGFGWQAAPFKGSEIVCYPVSGEFSVVRETLP